MTVPAGGRLEATFARLAGEGRAGLVTFVMAGDPDAATAREIVLGLPDAGADVVELGMPFSDPMADGPVIEAAGHRALKAGASLKTVLDLARTFRERHPHVPLVLMGYYNPIYRFGTATFAETARASGVDGLIVVDLPPEEDAELRVPLGEAGIPLIRLVTPTTGPDRLGDILDGAGGFVYYVAVAGITGTKSAAATDVATAVARIRQRTGLPVAVGFGIKTAAQAAAVAQVADAAVVGSALVSQIAARLDERGRPRPGLADDTFAFVREVAAGVHGVRRAPEGSGQAR